MRFIKKISILFQNFLWCYGVFKGVAANIELLPFIKKIKKINTLIDVGSNKGQFILLCIKFFPNLLIYSFEPIKEALIKQKNLLSFKNNIYFYNTGIGNKKKKINFFITNRVDSSSFLTINKSKNYNKNYYVKEKRKIKIQKLDQILNNKKLIKPVLIKIDVQGFELEVLKGSKKTLPNIDYLLLEVSKNQMYNKQAIEIEIINFLKKEKFRIMVSSKWKRINNTEFMQRDILFKRKIN
tara:strand:+ start:1797 stop:2513 length:717 start_codon:yes stop_codon:yes gene_type:complete